MSATRVIELVCVFATASVWTGLAATAESGDASSGATPRSEVQPRLYAGLEVRLYPRNAEKQPQNAGGYLDLHQLGKPTGKALLTRTLAPMKYDANYNAVARGFLKIDDAGEYVFNANNFYDRNALFIDGKLICPYRDGEHTEQKVVLTSGLHEIAVVGYVEARGTVAILWKPPAAEKLSSIPENRLFCTTPPQPAPNATRPGTPPATASSDASSVAGVEIPKTYALLDVKGMMPSRLDAEPAHPCIQDALIYSRTGKPGLPGGELEFEVKRGGLVFLIASWKYDGNPSGGWTQNAVTYGMLADKWAPLGVCPWDPSHSLFFRYCEEGEAFAIRTRKYNAPQPIVAKPIDIHDEAVAPHIPAEAQDTFALLRFRKLFREQNYAELDSLAAAFRRDQTIYSSGSTALGLLYWSLTNVTPENSRSLEQRINDIEEWRSRRPDSITAKIASANTRARLGDFARGGRLASQVSDVQLGAYQEGHEQAMEILEPLLKAETGDPELYASLIHSSRALGAEADDVRDWTLKAFRIYPWYVRAINASATFFLPRWYGSQGDLVRLAESLADAAGDDADAAYAKVVLAVRNYAHISTLNEDSFDMERLSRGMNMLQERYPRSRRIRDEACYLACLALDRDRAGELFAKIGDDPELKVWRKRELYSLWRRIFSSEASEGEQISLFMPHVLGTRQAIYSSDGKHIVTAGSDGFLQVRDVVANKQVADVRAFGDGIGKLRRFDDHVVLTGSDRGLISLWDWKSGAFRAIAQLPGAISCLDYRSANQRLLAGTSSGAMIVVEMRTGKTIFQSRGGLHSGKVVARFSPDGKYFVTSGGDGRVSIYGVKIGREETAIPSDGAQKTSVAMSHDGKYVAAGARNGIVSVWEVATGKLLGNTEKTEVDATDLEFSPDDKLLGVAFGSGKYSEFGNCSIIRLELDGLSKRDIAGHSMAVFSIEFSTDGTEMLTAGGDWTVRRYAVKELASDD
ncbi:MAG: WD40 repeat domain-containing protein [Planctomycetota bacterium]|jgi:WD40 repeat protein